jgi:hypothetical protein
MDRKEEEEGKNGTTKLRVAVFLFCSVCFS